MTTIDMMILMCLRRLIGFFAVLLGTVDGEIYYEPSNSSLPTLFMVALDQSSLIIIADRPLIIVIMKAEKLTNYYHTEEIIGLPGSSHVSRKLVVPMYVTCR